MEHIENLTMEAIGIHQPAEEDKSRLVGERIFRMDIVPVRPQGQRIAITPTLALIMAERQAVSELPVRPGLNCRRPNRAEFADGELREGTFGLPLHLGRRISHDIDDAVKGVEAVNGGGRPFPDLDFF